MTKVIKIDPQTPSKVTITLAAKLLQDGQLVAFPTETVYGLGAHALDAQAVRKIFQAKERPSYDPLIVHLHTIEALPRIARNISETVYALAEAFWPGPLTLILPRQDTVPDIVTSGLPTVAVRIPSHPVALALLQAANLPVAAPSANRFGYTSPTTAAHVLADLNGRIPLILDGGPTHIGVESTVLDMTSTPPRILRPGGVSLEALRRILGAVTMAVQPEKDTQQPPSPGMLPRHYAPHAHLVLFKGAPESVYQAMKVRAKQALKRHQKLAFMLPDEDRKRFENFPQTAQFIWLGSLKHIPDISKNLYAAMRQLDQAGAEIVLTHNLPETGLGAAINNRLSKAAAEIIETDKTNPDKDEK